MRSTHDVVCFPDMVWDYPLWTNRQHVMSRLPRIAPEVRVLYVSPPRFIGSVLRARSRGAGLLLEKRSERLWVLHVPLPAPRRLLQSQARELLDRWTLVLTRATMRRLCFGTPVVWSYTPMTASVIGRLENRMLVYDVVDDYAALPFYAGSNGRAAVDDRCMTETADVVFTTSMKLQRDRMALNPNCHHVGNAADIELFARARSLRWPEPPDLAAVARPRLAYHGALTSHKLDLELIGQLARRCPDWSFVFIGPCLEGETREALSKFSNVHLLGTKPQPALPAYLAGCALSIVPYRRTPYTESVNALKVFECIAAGLHVVSTDLPGFREVADHIHVAGDAGEFEAAIERVLSGAAGESPQLPEGGGPTWERKTATMWTIVQEALHRGGH
jgi:hypothetical protein